MASPTSPSSSSTTPPPPPSPSRRPNVVFILTDDQGYGELSCHGNPNIQTPNIDTFHSTSVRFTDYHVGTTCAPTRSGLLTGHYCNSTGVWHTIGGRSLLRENEWTLPQALRESGYSTAHFGKWHLGDAQPFRPFERGFDLSIYHGGGGVGNTPDNWGNDYFDDTYFVNGRPEKFRGYCTDVFFGEAIKFIETCCEENRKDRHDADDDDEENSNDKPFFVYIATNAPHGPFNVENHYADLYRPIAPTEDQACFYGMVTNIDENVGKFRTRLHELGLDDNTILVFMSDNGSGGGVSNYDSDGHVTEGPCNYNAGMRGVKGWEYEGGHRVPFFMHCPENIVLGPTSHSSSSGGDDGSDSAMTGADGGRSASLGNSNTGGGSRSVTDGGAGRDVTELTSYVDFMPTILDLCDAKVPPERQTFDGISLGPTIRGWEQPELTDRIMVTDTQRLARPVKWHRSCVMKNKFRLVNGLELYNLDIDPRQCVDVGKDHPDMISELRRAYEEWWKLVSIQFDLDVPFALGQDSETVALSAMDIRNEAGDVPWLQEHVRMGKVCSGYWAVDVRSSGTYTIELRRWDKHTGYKLKDGIDGDDSGWRKDCIQHKYARMYEGGKAMDLRWAHVTIAGTDLFAEIVDNDAKSVLFDVELPLGEMRLYAGFFEKLGGGNETIVPYYVYVTKKAVQE